MLEIIILTFFSLNIIRIFPITIIIVLFKTCVINCYNDTLIIDKWPFFQTIFLYIDYITLKILVLMDKLIDKILDKKNEFYYQ